MNNDYKNKYLKYKSKYLDYKKFKFILQGGIKEKPKMSPKEQAVYEYMSPEEQAVYEN